ncbi:hypothetical protein Pmani_009900 [Petrolisthes manimaculis]|uniref:Uncharacterized protein n=1 Tax=Petrolisthes manimaculis TaxID=1843537 RepID=A0AAE1Q2J8_9EUCA|nr:hypothetical protein Pmani_009900 [Petrolisthes manimaculis]
MLPFQQNIENPPEESQIDQWDDFSTQAFSLPSCLSSHSRIIRNDSGSITQQARGRRQWSPAAATGNGRTLYGGGDAGEDKHGIVTLSPRTRERMWEVSCPANFSNLSIPHLITAITEPQVARQQPPPPPLHQPSVYLSLFIQ